MAFNLNDYEDVASLNRWFQDNFPTGRLILSFVHEDYKEQEVVIECALFRDMNDKDPAVVNVARGKASDYPKNMQRWYVEDTATSAIGRAILLIKGAQKTATKDSMRQVAQADSGHNVEHSFKPIEAVKEVANEPETYVWPDETEVKAFEDNTDIMKAFNAEVIGFKCKHGDMILKEGTGKTGKPYHGFVCGARSKNEQCPSRWADQVNGQWVFKGKAMD
jgi:hypothetical protein